MAALTRPTRATYEVHENISVDTQDNEDHTFCGIMFPVKCKALLPLDHLLIKSVAVRGRLGPLTVWVSKPEDHGLRMTGRLDSTVTHANHRVRLSPEHWIKLYEKCHAASRTKYTELVLDEPIRLVPGQTRVIYIHSTLPGDEAIVYDNAAFHGYHHNVRGGGGNANKRYEDDKLIIQTGRAHVSNEVFGQEPIWGWGNAWRDRREFVGRLHYGTVYKLWSPTLFPQFGPQFQEGARTLFLCQRRWESPFSMLSDECIFYILNMCPWNHFDDNSQAMKELRKQAKARQVQLREAEMAQKELQQGMDAQVNVVSTLHEAIAEDVAGVRKRSADCTSRCEAARQRVCAMLEEGDDADSDADEEYKDCVEDEESDKKLPAVLPVDADDDEDHDQKLANEEDHNEEEGDDDLEDEDADDMEEYVPMDDDDEEEEEGDDDWSEDSEQAQYYRANVDEFEFQEVNSDSDSDDEEGEGMNHYDQQAIMGQIHRMLFAHRGIP